MVEGRADGASCRQMEGWMGASYRRADEVGEERKGIGGSMFFPLPPLMWKPTERSDSIHLRIGRAERSGGSTTKRTLYVGCDLDRGKRDKEQRSTLALRRCPVRPCPPLAAAPAPAQARSVR